MLKTIQKKYKNALMKLKPQIEICKICFNPIKSYDFLKIFSKNQIICQNCRREFKPQFIKFYEEKIECLSLYYYGENIKSLIYQFKGCYDIELFNVFLHPYVWYLKLKFYGYKMLLVPSWKIDDIKREFNHVEKIFSVLNLPMLKIVQKSIEFKQSDLSTQRRKEIKNYLTVTDYKPLKNKKILIVDDIYTTGSTIKAMIDIAIKGGARQIKVLTLAKTKYEEKKQ